MKKLFLNLLFCGMAFMAYAGANDLLWDYTEGAPASSPDNGLYFNNKAADAAGTNNGLKGIKLNSSGYCYFTKAAVAGKLKLSFGPRSGSNASALDVFTWSGETPAAETLIATTGQQTEYGTQIVELTAVQNNIYIKRNLPTETVLQKIEFTETVARTFVDFKIEFRDNPYTVLLPESGVLPAGVTVENTSYNGGQHGIFGGTITVPVDGPVKFTIGACQYSGTPIVIKKDGVKLLDFSNNASCGETAGNFAQNVTYTYTGGAGTLTFDLAGNTYVPYFFAEATDVTPCEVIFKDQAGAELFRIETIEGATLDTLPDPSILPVQGETWRFRGWFYTNGKKAKLGDPINGNTTIQAKVTPIENVTVGSIQTYDFTSPIFYPEDHETVEVEGGYYHDAQHGWAFKNGEKFAVWTSGKRAVIVLEICQYGTANAVWKEINMSQVPGLITPDSCVAVGSEGGQMIFKYSYPEFNEPVAAVFELHNTGGENYLHRVTVYNVEDFLEKDANTGYLMVPTGDAASFILALAQAEAGDKIFLPNGTYDLGETVLTTISKDNISIIGQSMEGVIIRNAPDAKTESIDKTATLRLTGTNIYLQDLTIQNALDYYKNDNGRAVALWSKNDKTICKNVRLLSYQDTYYSNKIGGEHYFEDCEIHGTVDFICGDGTVYFKNNLLYCEKRKAAGGGNDALTASNADASDKGYVFESCRVQSECPTVSLGRMWNNSPQCVFLNTVFDYSKGQFTLTGSGIQRWTLELMNAGAWPNKNGKVGEYNTKDVAGNVISPASNVATFFKGNDTQNIETILTADEAAAYSYSGVFGSAWDPAADAAQAVVETGTFDPEGIYLLELLEDRSYSLVTGAELNAEVMVPGVTIRKANARGGFGPVAGKDPGSAVEDLKADCKASKVISNGQVIIVRDGVRYNVLGTQVR